MPIRKPFKTEYDFDYLKDTLTGKTRGGPIPIMELFADPEVMSEVTGIDYPAAKAVEIFHDTGSLEESPELMEMGIRLLLVAVLLHLFFLVWDIDATAWVASAGIIGIAVGFAARDTIANLISGVSIVADAPYKLGDWILLDSGERGLVTNLGIRSTRIRTRDDVEISIPNAVIGTTKIINESGGPFVRHRIRVPIGVAYSSDIDKVVETLKGIASENQYMVDEPAPRVRLRGFGDSSINLELLGWINNPADRGLTVDRLCRHRHVERASGRNVQHPLDAVLDPVAVRHHPACDADDGVPRIPELEEFHSDALEPLVRGPLQPRR